MASEKKQRCLRSSSSSDELDANLGFIAIPKFQKEKLPSKAEVIGYSIHALNTNQNICYEEVTHFCSNTLGEHWIKRIIHPIRLKCIKGKVKSVREEFRRLKRVGAPRRNERWKTDLTNFTSEKNKLFDVFCEDKNERKKLETIHGIPMEEKEYKFLEAMPTNRTGGNWHVLACTRTGM